MDVESVKAVMVENNIKEVGEGRKSPEQTLGRMEG